MSRDINLLVTELKEIVYDFIGAMHEAKIDYVICCTLRTNAEQDDLYVQGRTKSGKIITNAKAGESAHNFGCAFDIAIFDHGKYASDKHPDWARAGKIGMDLGLEWLGAADSKFKELAHFQLKDWKRYKNGN